VTLIDPPGDPARHYDPGYHAIPMTPELLEQRLEHERYKIEMVLRFVQGGTLVEIGPSWGAFCLLAKRCGFSVEAIELDPKCCEFLTATLGIKATLGDRAMAALDHMAAPDVIALWHVIEHLPEPLSVLERAAARLAPGGILVVASPNPEALQFRLFRRYWGHLDAPRHVNLIPARTLRHRAERLGLESVYCTTTDPGSLECNVFGWRKSLSNVVPQALKAGVYHVGRLAADVAGPVERREGKGGAYTAIFRKPAAGDPA
jgi:SAM-dependent methyltransferase